MQFKDWLSRELMGRGWTPAEAARQIPMDETLLSRYLNGKRAPSRHTAVRLAEALNTPIADLLGMIQEQDRADAAAGRTPAELSDAEVLAGIGAGIGSAILAGLPKEAQAQLIDMARRSIEIESERR